MRISVFCLVLNLMLAFWLARHMQRSGSGGEAGLAIANTLSATCNVTLLLYALRRKLRFLAMAELWRSLLVLGTAAAAAGGLAWGLGHLWAGVPGRGKLFHKIGAVFVPGGAAGLAYWFIAVRMRISAATEMADLVRNASNGWCGEASGPSPAPLSDRGGIPRLPQGYGRAGACAADGPVQMEWGEFRAEVLKVPEFDQARLRGRPRAFPRGAEGEAGDHLGVRGCGGRPGGSPCVYSRNSSRVRERARASLEPSSEKASTPCRPAVVGPLDGTDTLTGGQVPERIVLARAAHQAAPVRAERDLALWRAGQRQRSSPVRRSQTLTPCSFREPAATQWRSRLTSKKAIPGCRPDASAARSAGALPASHPGRRPGPCRSG